MLVGLGVTGAAPAVANGEVTADDCTDANTVNSSTGGDRDDIQTLLTAAEPVVCLVGEFAIDETLDAVWNVTLVGNPSATLTGQNTQILFSRYVNVTTAVHNLEFRDGRGITGGAISAYAVEITNSTFVDNSAVDSGGAVNSVYASIVDSTFVDNSTTVDNPDADQRGGAVSAQNSLQVTGSIFTGNSARDGGAVASGESLFVLNSTFVDNSAAHEGGAVFGSTMSLEFSTFLENTAATPEPDEELPGEAVYVQNYLGSDIATFYGNIFAGESGHPQIGVGGGAVTMIDLGGNVFTTSEVAEDDLPASDTSVFGASVTAIFGSAPALADNGGSTQTLALVEDSPAIDVVPPLVEPGMAPAAAELTDTDQRGEPRTGELYDAGSFEFQPSDVVAPPAADGVTPRLPATGSDPSTSGWLAGIATLLLGAGAAVLIVARRRARR